MDDLIAKVLSGEATELEVRQLERWRNESPANARAYAEFERVWEMTPEPDGRSMAPPGVADIVAQAEERRRNVVSLTGWRYRRSRRWQRVAAAAAVLVLLSIPWMRSGPETVRYATGAGEHTTVTLDDGSIVRLGPESQLEVFAESARAMRLTGRAFFAVATDSTRPFTVETPVGMTQVLGTRFEITSSGDSLRLTVVEGLVALSAEGERVEVARGEVSRVLAGSGPTPAVSEDVWALLDWPNGLLIFQATPLGEAFEQIGRHFGVSTSINDAEMAARTVTAWFDDASLEEVVSTVCAVVGAQCDIGDQVEVR